MLAEGDFLNLGLGLEKNILVPWEVKKVCLLPERFNLGAGSILRRGWDESEGGRCCNRKLLDDFTFDCIKSKGLGMLCCDSERWSSGMS